MYNDEIEMITPQNATFLKNKHCFVLNNKDKRVRRPKAVKIIKNERGVCVSWKFIILYPDGTREVVTEKNGDWRIAR